LNFISRSASNDGLTAHLFFLHEHQDNNTSLLEWKEAHLRVILERYVSPTDPTCRYQVDTSRTAAFGHMVTCLRVVYHICFGSSMNTLTARQAIQVSATYHRK
jgi:hypothetical protein